MPWVFKLAFAVHYWSLSLNFLTLGCMEVGPERTFFLIIGTIDWAASEKSLKTTGLCDTDLEILETQFYN